MSPDLRILGEHDAPILDRVAPGVFDGPILPVACQAFLRDPHHHMVIAPADDVVVGMVSAVEYLHPDKPTQMWINELGVGDEWRRQGIGRSLVQRMVQLGRARGCAEIWLATEADNEPARALYQVLGTREEAAVVYFFGAK